MQTEEIINLIQNNWAQVTIVIGAIGYLLKTLFDRKSKQIEIKTKVYYENKFSQIESINKKYSDLNIAYKELIAIKAINPTDNEEINKRIAIVAELYKSIQQSLTLISIYTDLLHDEHQPDFKGRLNKMLKSLELIKNKDNITIHDQFIFNTVLLNLDISFHKMIKNVMK